jgi:esterase
VSETGRTGFAPSGDVRIHYRAFGKPGKTPIVIVHGLSYFSYDWTGPAASLATDREVVAIDQRGFGESDWSSTRKYDLRQQAADIIAVLDHFGWKQAILVGHSMGGRICLCATAWYPERVAALVSLDFAPDLAPPGRRHVAEQIGRQPDLFTSVDEAIRYHKSDPADAAVRERFLAFLKPVPGGFALKRDLHYRDQFRQVLETGKSHQTGVDAWALLADIKVPTLVVRASNSELFAAETMDKVRSTNPRAEVAELEGGHDLAHDNPDALVALVRQFLAKLA